MRHSLAPEAFWYKPGSQSVQRVSGAVLLKRPAEHSSHSLWPTAEAKRPLAQLTQAVSAGAAA